LTLARLANILHGAHETISSKNVESARLADDRNNRPEQAVAVLAWSWGSGDADLSAVSVTA